jgi:hypothetical protein
VAKNQLLAGASLILDRSCLTTVNKETHQKSAPVVAREPMGESLWGARRFYAVTTLPLLSLPTVEAGVLAFASYVLCTPYFFPSRSSYIPSHPSTKLSDFTPRSKFTSYYLHTCSHTALCTTMSTFVLRDLPCVCVCVEWEKFFFIC